ncbi:PilZ domain-containing protein [Leptospira ilyithenensis]|uniref:PilZ domain-containing protein n=1 Tax=Leptospira ilyithenensis TaxID=2484901 RepID=A0A4R9LV91_9LEPT|nr:PilZ domain-containing protein [Leptospira ilyithenensis]TGN14500.1 PilZ domain-containing protein [Leptospira ilyithenensis]
MSQERRIYKRISEKVHITYRVIQSGSDKMFLPKDKGEGETQDISEGGLLFSTKEPMPIGARLELELRFPDVRYVLYPRAKVVRLEEFNEGEFYEVGLEFNQLFENDKKLILEHIIRLGG